MKEIELFHLTNCPYCIHARNAIEALQAEEPAFREIGIRWIEESQHPELTEGHDYYYVPSVFYNGTKLYEAKPGQDYETVKANIRRSFETVLKS